MMVKLRVWFYDPTKDSDGLFNKLVSKLDGPFCHCELQFPDDASCSIYMGTNVTLKKRTFDPTNYTCVAVLCSKKEQEAAQLVAAQHQQRGTPFSAFAMSYSMLWMPMPLASDTTFCSKLVADLLKTANVLPQSFVSEKITPSALHRILTAPSSAAPRLLHAGAARSTPIGFR